MECLCIGQHCMLTKLHMGECEGGATCIGEVAWLFILFRKYWVLVNHYVSKWLCHHRLYPLTTALLVTTDFNWAMLYALSFIRQLKVTNMQREALNLVKSLGRFSLVESGLKLSLSWDLIIRSNCFCLLQITTANKKWKIIILTDTSYDFAPSSFPALDWIPHWWILFWRSFCSAKMN